jgi:hypothetical protein
MDASTSSRLERASTGNCKVHDQDNLRCFGRIPVFMPVISSFSLSLVDREKLLSSSLGGAPIKAHPHSKRIVTNGGLL